LKDKGLNALRKQLLCMIDKSVKQCPTFGGYGRWDDAAGKKMLREDVKNNFHRNMKPNHRRQSKIEAYGEFPLGVF
jgi:hypothetical protein